MSDVTLSKAVRSNLLHLQNTARIMDITQERLATGKKVNSALDNPTNFFTASALNARAADLGQLLDSISSAVQTIAMADKAISAITKLVESAQSTARQALQSSAPGFTLVGGTTLGADANAASVAGDLAQGTAGETITISDGGRTRTYALGTDFSTVAELEDRLRADGLRVTATGTDGNFVLRSTTAGGTFTISGDVAEDVFGLSGANTYRATNPDLDALVAAGHSIDVISNGRTQTLTFGDGAIENRADLVTALNGLRDVSAQLVDGRIEIATKGGNPFEISASDPDVNTALGLPEGIYEATEGTTRRHELVADYNKILTQIDELTRDGHFNGVNLLNGDTLRVLFSEDGVSGLDLQGVTRDAASLGLFEISSEDWNTNVNVDETLDRLKGAIDTLRADASRFGSSLSIVENRQNFTKEMINVLETGAANLTLADTNEEAANMLALQTRQQLSQTALSLASQADQAVLRLFG